MQSDRFFHSFSTTSNQRNDFELWWSCLLIFCIAICALCESFYSEKIWYTKCVKYSNDLLGFQKVWKIWKTVWIIIYSNENKIFIPNSFQLLAYKSKTFFQSIYVFFYVCGNYLNNIIHYFLFFLIKERVILRILHNIWCDHTSFLQRLTLTLICNLMEYFDQVYTCICKWNGFCFFSCNFSTSLLHIFTFFFLQNCNEACTKFSQIIWQSDSSFCFKHL